MTTNFEEKAINRMLKAGISLQHIQMQREISFKIRK